MRRRIAALVTTALALVGCSSEHHDPDPVACRKAIKAQYVPGTAVLKGKPGRPKECGGLSADEVSEIALSVIQENTQ